MNPYLVLVFIGLCYILVFGGLSLVRREGLSNRFAFEVLGLIAVVVLPSWALGIQVSPVLFLVLIYLVSMRVRILIDLANTLTALGRFELALPLYRLAPRLWPDASCRRLALINLGVAHLRMDSNREAARLLEEAMGVEGARMSPKHKAALHYNLGLAYKRLGERGKAMRHLSQAMEAWPGSIYAQHAQRLLKEVASQRKSGSGRGEKA